MSIRDEGHATGRESSARWAVADELFESIRLVGWLLRPVFSEFRSKIRRAGDEDKTKGESLLSGNRWIP